MPTPFTILDYTTDDGIVPFAEWFKKLRDMRAKVRISSRINRLECGNFGDCKAVGDGVSELRIDYGPGYRIYFSRQGTVLLLLLCGGDKTTQSGDILRAIAYKKHYEAKS